MMGSEDIFTPIHKGLRSMLYSLSNRLQTNDFADVAATRALVTDLEYDFAAARSAGCVLCVLNHHATDEEAEIFPKVSPVAAELTGQLIREHHELTGRERAITEAAHELLALPSAADRVAAGIRLNHRANELFVAYFAHMNREETELVPLMLRHFTDPQMAAMRGAIIAHMPPPQLMFILGWMLPALNATELADLITGAQKGAPPPLVKAVVELCAQKVDPARWAQVKLRVGV